MNGLYKTVFLRFENGEGIWHKGADNRNRLIRNKLPAEVIRIYLGELLLVIGQILLGKNRIHGAFGNARAAVGTFVGIDVQLLDVLQPALPFGWVNT